MNGVIRREPAGVGNLHGQRCEVAQQYADSPPWFWGQWILLSNGRTPTCNSCSEIGKKNLLIIFHDFLGY